MPSSDEFMVEGSRNYASPPNAILRGEMYFVGVGVDPAFEILCGEGGI